MSRLERDSMYEEIKRRNHLFLYTFGYAFCTVVCDVIQEIPENALRTYSVYLRIPYL